MAKVPRDITEFSKRVRSVLWRQDSGKEKPTYNAWLERVEYLQSPDGGAYTKPQAIVRASKEHKCLERLFREYDVKEFDPNPESHASIVYKSDITASGTLADVICDNVTQTYRESLQWAIEAAGCYMRTGKSPISCPCDTAFYLYQQAIQEPKDFLSRVGQIESKGLTEDAEAKDLKRAGRRSIKEIEAMLEEMTKDDSA
jgi:hypothetical protein